MAPGLMLSMQTHTMPPLEIFVGPEKQKFFAIKDVICATSEFFKSACKSDWSSGRENSVALAEEDPKIFAIFLSWMCTAKIEATHELVKLPTLDEVIGGKPQVNIEGAKAFANRFVQLCLCFFLGEFLQSPGFKNDIMDEIVRLAELGFRTQRADENYSKIFISYLEPLGLICKKTPESSPLRRFVIEYFACNLNPKELAGKIEEIREVGGIEIIQGIVQFTVFNIQLGIDGLICPIRQPWDREKGYFHEPLDETE